MAIASLVQTTLSAALNGSATTLSLTSLTGVVNGDILYVRGEAIKVSDTTSTLANPLSVVRGYSGTRSHSHPNLARVYHGEPDLFKQYRDGAIGLFGDSGDFPEFLIPGAKATDDDGNEYIMVDAGAQLYTGVTAQISLDGLYVAAVHTSALRGSVGIAVEQIDSTESGWLQVFGYHAAAQDAGGDTAATSASIAIAATSVSTPAAGMASFTGTTVEQALIYGMFIVGIASTATTSATSFVGSSVPVWLNHPYSTAIVDFTLDPTS